MVFNFEKAGGYNYRNRQQCLNGSQKIGVVLTERDMGWLYRTQCPRSKMNGQPTRFLLSLYNQNNSRTDGQEAEDIHSNKMYGPLLLDFRPDPVTKGEARCSTGELCNTIISIHYNYLIGLSPK